MNSIRPATYALLAQLFLAPPTPELLHYLAALPPFDEVLRDTPINGDAVERYQVLFQELFGFTMFPYESLFREQELMVNGATAEQVQQFAAYCGLDVSQYGMGAADHIGIELTIMARLLEREMSAEQYGHEGGMVWAQRQQAEWVHKHLAGWIPIAMMTLERITDDALYYLVARLTREMVLYEVGLHPLPTDIDEPTVEELLLPLVDDDADVLNRVVRRLITPDEIGLFLTRIDIRRMARQLQLPLGMGDRFTMVRQLFEGAGQFGQVPLLLATLDDIWQAEEVKIKSLMEEYESWHPYGAAWLDKAATGRQLLVELQQSWNDLAPM